MSAQVSTGAEPIASGGGAHNSRTAAFPRRLLRRPALIWPLTVAVALTGLVVFAGSATDYSPLMEPHLSWWLLTLMFVVGERCVVHLEFRRSAHSFSLADLPLVAGLLFSSGGDLLVGNLLGTSIVLIAERRVPPIKFTFNLAQTTLCTCLAMLIVHQLAPADASLGPGTWGAVFLATQVSAAVAVLLIGAAISLSEGGIRPRTLGSMLAIDSAVTLTNTSLALGLAIILTTDARAIPLLVVPVATVFFAYRAYMRERQRHEKLEFLYEATRTLSRTPDIVMALEGLMTKSRDAFRAEVAEVILLGSEANPPLRTTLGPGSHKDIMQPVDKAIVDELLSLTSMDRPVVRISQSVAGERVRRYLESRHVTDAMVALLPGENRLIGTIMIANRFGVVRSFRDDDLKLFETLANNTSVALQYDRLEQAVFQLRELQTKLEHQAFHDPLTNLANRSKFANLVRDSLVDAGRELAILFIDVDDFKTINDSLGHEAGDELLVSVAERLQECVRPSDLVARLGGDEFAVMVADPGDVQVVAIQICDRIMMAFQSPMSTAGETVTVHVSVGLATTIGGSRRANELIRDADVAMYQAKAAGKQRFELFETRMRSAVVRRHGLKEELRKALSSGELAVEYQPIIALDSGEAEAAEALIRWRHPGRGLLLPRDFVPLAEETGLITEIGQLVLDEACAQAARWRTRNDRAPKLHVNLSAVELRDPLLVDRVQGSLAVGGLSPDRLVLEITESVLMEDATTSAATLAELRQAGIQLALDDFGTGYSSLSYLRSLPLDMLKIAMPFIDDLERKQDDSFVKMIVQLAGALDLRVVAEGIATAAQLSAVRRLGCHYGQGFYLGRSVRSHETPFATRVTRSAHMAA